MHKHMRLYLPIATTLAGLLLLCACQQQATVPPERLAAEVSTNHPPGDYNDAVQQLYIAYFGRPADTSGLANFCARLSELGAPTKIAELASAYDRDADLRALIDSFGSSDESKALYSGTTEAFVQAIYLNVLNRSADAEGLAFWVDAIDHHGLTRGNAALSIMAGALSNTSTQGQIDATIVTNKTATSTAFAGTLLATAQAGQYSGDAAAAQARAMLNTVTASTNSAAIATLVNNTVAGLVPQSGYNLASMTGSYTFVEYFNNSNNSPATAPFRINVPNLPFSTTVDVNVAKLGFTVDLGTVTLDGAGGFTMSRTSNVDGASSTSTASGSYTVMPDGTVRFGNMTARILAGGAAFIMASGSSDPEIGIGIRNGGSFSNASLNGSYAIGDYYNQSNVSNAVSHVRVPDSGSITVLPFASTVQIPIGKKGFTTDFGTINFDGAGGYTLSLSTNRDGTVTSSNSSGSYAVTADGTVSLFGMTGKVLSGGGIFVLASAAGDPRIALGLRMGAALPLSAIKGTYSFTDYFNNSNGANANAILAYNVKTVPSAQDFSITIAKKGFTSSLGSITLDGAGGATLTRSVNVDGVLSSMTFSGSYSIDSTGLVTIGNMTGRMLDGGTIFVMVAPAGDPEIGWGIAK